MINGFPVSSRPYLAEIANRLYSGHAAIMVGAGFSRNAIKNDHTKPNFPNWLDLGDAFYQKLYGRIPTEGENFLNAMKLAEEVEAAFGRSVLEQMLRELIPDRDHQPSLLHQKLLHLPWSDVLTTNYDTLLERAADQVLSKKYDLVVNKNDLIYAESPRIIKLHGSFPSEGPLIITEEDYRTYPRKSAPFVNTVQQALIENTLCLIGFSGDDPNFLSWIGWILDNLGRENAPKVYLIGITNLSDAQQKLLGSKNVIIVNLSESSSNHYKALERFVDFLMLEEKKDQQIDWPDSGQHTFNSTDTNSNDLLEKWEKSRKNYPNWLVLSRKQRTILWQDTSSFTSGFRFQVPTHNERDLRLYYELNWRLEKCLVPIPNGLDLEIEAVLKKYTPFFDGSETIAPEKSFWEMKSMWLELQIALLRYYREEYQTARWIETDELLEKYSSDLNTEQVAKFWYERSLNTLFTFNSNELKTVLKKWPVNENLPYWEAKRAGLLAELGESEQAMKILSDSLIQIRKRLQLSPVISDYTWVSQEAYVMILFRYIKNKVNGRIADKLDLDSHFDSRQNLLKVYKCDPQGELSDFELLLSPAPIRSDKTSNADFELGKSNRTTNFGKYGADIMRGYTFLRFIEEIGLPPRLGNIRYGSKAFNGAIERIALFSTNWALATLIRIEDDSPVKNIFDRNFINQLELTDVSRLIKISIDLSENAFRDFDSKILNPYGLRNLVTPEILARLSTKSTHADRDLLLNFLLKIYSSEYHPYFKGCSQLAKRLISAIKKDEISYYLPMLMRFPIVDHDKYNDYADPWGYLNLGREGLKTSGVKIDQQQFNELIAIAKKNNTQRHAALARLNKLDRLKLLSRDQQKKYADALWIHRAENGLPANTNYTLFSFINLPAPANVNPIALFKKYILESEIPIHNKAEKSEGLSLTRGDITILNNLANSQSRFPKDFGLTWTKDEIKVIFNKLSNWWSLDKKYLLEKDEETDFFSSTYQEFRDRFSNLSLVMRRVIAAYDFWKNDSFYRTSVINLIKEMDQYQLPVQNLKVNFIELFPDSSEKIFKELMNVFAGQERTKLVDVGNSIIDLFYNASIFKKYHRPLKVLVDMLIDQIKWRSLTRMDIAIDVLRIITVDTDYRMDKTQIEGLLFGLDCLKRETDPKKKTIEISDLLLNRKKAARLASTLFNCYPEIKSDVLDDWKEICSSDNEFIEIRTQWST